MICGEQCKRTNYDEIVCQREKGHTGWHDTLNKFNTLGGQFRAIWPPVDTVKARREQIAIRILAGFCACPRSHENRDYEARHFVTSTLEFADELIKRLDE